MYPVCDVSDIVFMLPSLGMLSECMVKRGVSAPCLSREELLESLRDVIAMAFEKIRYVNTSNDERRAWSRIIVNAVGSSTPLIKDRDLDDLKKRLEQVESRLRIGVVSVS